MQYESPQVHGQYEPRYRSDTRVIVQGQPNRGRNVIVNRPSAPQAGVVVQTQSAQPAPQRQAVIVAPAPAPAPSAIVNAPPQARANEEKPTVVTTAPSANQAQSTIRVHD